MKTAFYNLNVIGLLSEYVFIVLYLTRWYISLLLPQHLSGILGNGFFPQVIAQIYKMVLGLLSLTCFDL